jgi:hypothetical protein
MADERVLEMTIGFDQDWYCPWGLARIITVEEAMAELKEFLDEHDLAWNYSNYNPLAHRLEIRHWDMDGEHDHHFYGLCPVDGENPSVMYADHPKFLEESCWQVLLDWDEVFTTASEESHEDDEESGVQEGAGKD